MIDAQNKLSIMVVKRNGKKVDFDGSKIAIAIKKGFDNTIILDANDEEERGYTEKDINQVYNGVIKRIQSEYEKSGKVQIEEIQDLIEAELKTQGYDDVYDVFSEYRSRRAQSRELFFDDKRRHKFLKTIEGLGLKSANEDDTKRENANIDGDSAMGTMLQYGSTISKEFARTYLMKKKYSDAHDDGIFHIHDMDFLAMGTTTCMQIELDKLFKRGFSTGHGYLRPPKSIMSYSALAAIAIQSNQNDQHGGQSVPAFDYYMAPGVLNSFKKHFKQQIHDILDYQDLLSFISIERIVREIDKLNSIDVDIKTFEPIYKDSETIKRTFVKSYEKALQKTNRETYQAMEAFIHNLNTMHSRAGAQVPFSSINLGTDITSEGRMVTRNYLESLEAGLGKGETPIFPVTVFKLKEGLNYNPEDPSYDLFKLAMRVSAKRLFPNFSFLDAPFNLQYYKEREPKSEVGYMGCRTRVMADVTDLNNQTTGGRGNLSFTTINLPRIGIKHGTILKERKNPDMKAFYAELEEVLEMARDQLLERFELQCNKRIYNFPFLLAQGVWTDAEKLKPTDRLRKVLKKGTLTLGFIGLAETLKALIGSHQGETKEAQKLGLEIITFIRKKADEFADEMKLNFTLLATPAEGLAGRFVSIDQSIYGKIKGVTDKPYYTNSFHVPVSFHVSIKEKIMIEAPYHALTNAGHISYVELDGDAVQNLDAFESIIRLMKESGVGFGAINHPVDRDPVCGFIGVIGDTCPGCGRKEFDSVPIETLKVGS